jgi:hypothetical protein
MELGFFSNISPFLFQTFFLLTSLREYIGRCPHGMLIIHDLAL